jgi:hypothetical protein
MSRLLRTHVSFPADQLETTELERGLRVKRFSVPVLTPGAHSSEWRWRELKTYQISGSRSRNLPSVNFTQWKVLS